MTEAALRSNVANWLAGYAGIAEGSAKHKEILAFFNESGLCSRYTMTVKDPWCATAVSSAFIACGLAGKAGSGSLFECVECYCDSVVNKAITQGIWVENDAYVPKTGDVVLYDWQDTTGSSADNKGSTDHIGIVYSVSGSTIRVVEGNISNTVGYRNLQVNGKYIRGFITPKYSKFASSATTTTSTTTKTTTTTASTTTKWVASGVQKYKNGSTSEIVYNEPECKTKIGSLNPYEECYCSGKNDGAYRISYTVDDTNPTVLKCGFVQYSGGTTF